MSTFVLRTVGPAVVIVIEREGPTRLLSTAATPEEDDALDEWIFASRERAAVVVAALADRRRAGGTDRQERWTDAVRDADPRG